MTPIIEILIKHIINDKNYTRTLKIEVITVINRIINFETDVKHLYKSMNFCLLYNKLNEEIIYLTNKQKYFDINLDKNINIYLQQYINEQINLYNKYIIKL